MDAYNFRFGKDTFSDSKEHPFDLLSVANRNLPLAAFRADSAFGSQSKCMYCPVIKEEPSGKSFLFFPGSRSFATKLNFQSVSLELQRLLLDSLSLLLTTASNTSQSILHAIRLAASRDI